MYATERERESAGTKAPHSNECTSTSIGLKETHAVPPLTGPGCRMAVGGAHAGVGDATVGAARSGEGGAGGGGGGRGGSGDGGKHDFVCLERSLHHNSQGTVTYLKVNARKRTCQLGVCEILEVIIMQLCSNVLYFTVYIVCETEFAVLYLQGLSLACLSSKLDDARAPCRCCCDECRLTDAATTQEMRCVCSKHGPMCHHYELAGDTRMSD